MKKKVVLYVLFICGYLTVHVGMAQYKTIRIDSVDVSDSIEGQELTVNNRSKAGKGEVFFTKGFKEMLIILDDSITQVSRSGEIFLRKDVWPITRNYYANTDSMDEVIITIASNYYYLSYVYNDVFYTYYLDKNSMKLHQGSFFDSTVKGCFFETKSEKL